MVDFNKLRDKISKRQETNKTILSLLSDLVEKNPDLRFHQILHICDVEIQASEGLTKDLFYEESTVTLERVAKKITEI